MATFAPVRTAFSPAIPQNFAELGISESLVLDLMLRRMVIEGNCTLASLGRSLRLAVPIIDVAFKHMRQQQLVERIGPPSLIMQPGRRAEHPGVFREFLPIIARGGFAFVVHR